MAEGKCAKCGGIGTVYPFTSDANATKKWDGKPVCRVCSALLIDEEEDF